MHEVGRELNDVSPVRALRAKRRLDVGEDLAALGVEIARTDDAAVLVSGQLPGDEQELRRFDARDLRVLTHRLSENAGVHDLDFGHVGLAIWCRWIVTAEYARARERAVRYHSIRLAVCCGGA